MADERPLHIVFVPFMSPGHMILMIDIAILFARRGVAATVITTPGNEPLASPAIDRANSSATSTNYHPIHLHLLPFPSSAAHLLPSGRENLSSLSFSDFPAFKAAFDALQSPLQQLLLYLRPDCLVSDSIFYSTVSTAVEIGIPRLIFHGPGAFPLCVHDSLELHSTYEKQSPFLVEGLPNRIELSRQELSAIFDGPDMLRSLRDAEEKSFGIIVNTFFQLEPEYCNLYRAKPGRRAWFVGPAFLSGDSNHTDLQYHYRLLDWLNSKQAGSVVYVCFGSLCQFSASELKEIASGLETSGSTYLWVVKGAGGDEVTQGFSERGAVVKGWVPQVAVLGHAAVGGFVAHCGWNSTLEGVAAGVVMATLPLYYEQFVNEGFITELLGVGVRVRRGGGTAAVTAEELAAAVRKVMGGGEESELRRRRATEYAGMAMAAVEEGGSSYEDLTRLIEEVSNYRSGSY